MAFEGRRWRASVIVHMWRWSPRPRRMGAGGSGYRPGGWDAELKVMVIGLSILTGSWSHRNLGWPWTRSLLQRMTGRSSVYATTSHAYRSDELARRKTCFTTCPSESERDIPVSWLSTSSNAASRLDRLCLIYLRQLIQPRNRTSVSYIRLRSPQTCSRSGSPCLSPR